MMALTLKTALSHSPNLYVMSSGSVQWAHYFTLIFLWGKSFFSFKSNMPRWLWPRFFEYWSLRFFNTSQASFTRLGTFLSNFQTLQRKFATGRSKYSQTAQGRWMTAQNMKIIILPITSQSWMFQLSMMDHGNHVEPVTRPFPDWVDSVSRKYFWKFPED